MKTIISTCVVWCMLVTATLAQHTKVGVIRHAATIENAAVKSGIQVLHCQGLVNNPTSDLQWQPVLTPVPVIHPSRQDALIRKLKAERMKLKLESEKKRSGATEDATQIVTPTIGSNFAGNENNGMSPLDNSIAISNGGIIVSVANTTIEVDNTQGQNLYYKDLISFIGDPEIEGVCDPVVIYDSGADRFIFFCQVSPLNSVKSRLLIFFSKSNDPREGWWYYKITGNPIGDFSAFDYPKLAVSNNELYITGNLYFDNGQYNQSVIYQIPKAPGFSGQVINWQYWKGIAGNPFTLTPLSWGRQGNYGPGCYLVASESGDGSTIKFYDLTDDMSSGNAQLKYFSVNVTPYQVAPDALQPGTDVQLNTNDCRMLSGFYLNGTAHFVFHSMRNGGYTGINYNRLNVETLNNESSLFGLDGFDYAYPSVSSFSVDNSDKSVMIGFMKSGSEDYPSVRVVNCDHDMNWSPSTNVRSGDSYVYYTGSPERWGDYSGTSTKHNAGKPTVWVSGMYGNNSNRWATWIAEVYGSPAGVKENTQASRLQVYPNPAGERFSVEFSLTEPCHIEISVMDEKGSVVKPLYTGKGYLGKNHFSFSKNNLKPGIYFIVVNGNNKNLLNEKIIING